MAAPFILVLDNYDSFTFTLVDYLKVAGATVDVVRADCLTVADAMAVSADGVLVSPGPGAPADAGISVGLAAACIAARRPYLGVCLGHQALALATGGTVGRSSPMHGKIARVTHDSTGLFAALPSPIDCTRYHSLAVTDPGPQLLVNATSDDSVIMGLRHPAAPAHGVQFHPESIASSYGRRIVAAFVEWCRQSS